MATESKTLLDFLLNWRWPALTAVLWAPLYVSLAVTRGIDPAYEILSFLWVVGMLGVWRGIRRLEQHVTG